MIMKFRIDLVACASCLIAALSGGCTESKSSDRKIHASALQVVSDSPNTQTKTVKDEGAAGKTGNFIGRLESKLIKPTIKIMPFGDSITSGYTYRQPLWDLLKSNNISNIDFVGSLNGNSVPDGDHEGHACYKIVYILLPPGSGTFKKCMPNDNSAGDFTDLETWFSGSKPDIVLWHMGTNDAASREDPSRVMSAFSATLSKLRQRNPKVIILVAKILPMTVADVGPLNEAITVWAEANSTIDSKILVVDMNTGFDSALTYDGIHPNTAGGKWMAERWFKVLKTILN
jgi:hypothetical protein